MMATQLTIYLDIRRKKENGFYPVKLRVWNSTLKKAKLYPVNMDLSEKEFQRCWEAKKPRKEYREQRIILDEVLANANTIVKKISHFNFDELERKLFRKSGDGTNVVVQYQNVITQKLNDNDIGTAQSYDASLNSIIKFLNFKGVLNPNKLSFFEITKDWLNEYENFMTTERKRSLTTVGIYLRCLRALFNSAIAENEIEKEVYPFGKRLYQISTSKGKKKALTNEQLKILFESIPATQEQQKARDFFFFSYACNGMNMKDIALLRYKDIKDGSINFYRAKTINTSKANLRPITAYLNDFTRSIIDKYGCKSTNPNTLVFDIISDTQNAQEQKIRINNFTRFVNQHLKILSESIGLPKEISTYWARHSFATNSIRKGASMEFIQESLGHGDLKTTMSYFEGFDDESKREFAQHLMEF